MASEAMTVRKRFDIYTINTTTFQENLMFSTDVPHTLRIKRFATNEAVPLHYGSSFEILINDNVKGSIIIGGKRYQIRSRDVFVIQPYVIHATEVERCNGTQYNLKVSVDALNEFVNLQNLFLFNGVRFVDIPTRLDVSVFDRVLSVVNELIEKDDNIYARMRCIISLFECLYEQSNLPIDDVDTSYGGSNDKSQNIARQSLLNLMQWTRENYSRRITLDEAAKQLHMNRYYFCKYFKRMTNCTYFKYLNQVRMERAAMMMLEGSTVTNCCYECGFSSPSYFVRLFKETYGCTPTEYYLIMCPPGTNKGVGETKK